jgi:hypothetical protein
MSHRHSYQYGTFTTLWSFKHQCDPLNTLPLRFIWEIGGNKGCVKSPICDGAKYNKNFLSDSFSNKYFCSATNPSFVQKDLFVEAIFLKVYISILASLIEYLCIGFGKVFFIKKISVSDKIRNLLIYRRVYQSDIEKKQF